MFASASIEINKDGLQAANGELLLYADDQEELEATQRKTFSFDFSFAYGCRATNGN